MRLDEYEAKKPNTQERRTPHVLLVMLKAIDQAWLCLNESINCTGEQTRTMADHLRSHEVKFNLDCNLDVNGFSVFCSGLKTP
jgi:hypothetical protein